MLKDKLKWNKNDAEKWFFLGLFGIGTICIYLRFMISKPSDTIMVGFVTAIGGLALGRKIYSYKKTDSYYENERLNMDNPNELPDAQPLIQSSPFDQIEPYKGG